MAVDREDAVSGCTAAQACLAWLLGSWPTTPVRGRVTLCLLCREVNTEASREWLAQTMVLSGVWALALQPSEAQGRDSR